MWGRFLSGLVFGLLLLIEATAHAAEITSGMLNENTNAIYLSGEIDLADIERFRNVAEAHSSPIVFLASPGGKVFAGVEIGSIIRSRGFTTVVASETICASSPSCALIGLVPIEPLPSDFRLLEHRRPPTPDVPAERPTFRQGLAAAFETDNWLYNLLTGPDTAGRAEPWPHEKINLRERLKEAGREQDFDLYLDVFTEPEFRARYNKIERQREARKALDAMPLWQSVPAQIIAGGLDLPTLLPGGAFVRGIHGGFSVARITLNTAAWGGGASVAQETALHSMQGMRTLHESMINIGASVFLYGLLGAGGARLLSNASLASGGPNRIRRGTVMFGWLTGRRKRDEEFAKQMMRAAAEGHGRAQMRSAFSTIDVALSGNDDVTYAARAAAGLVRKLITTIGADPQDDDTIFAGGIFAFAAANHFSYQIGASFEQTSSLAMLDLAGGSPQEFKRTLDPVVNAYNRMTASSDKVMLAIGQNIARWTQSPTPEQFSRLSALFKTCLTNIRQVG